MKKNNSINTPKTAICYYRSTAVTQNRATIAQQHAAAHQYAKEHGITIIAEYSDVGGAASLDKRRGIQELLCDLRCLKPDCILIWKSNRISRDRFEKASFHKSIINAGCQIIYTAESNSMDENEQILIEVICDALAEHYIRLYRKDYKSKNCKYMSTSAQLKGKKGEE